MIATTTEPPVSIPCRHSPFRALPDRLNQHLQQVTGFLTPLRASFAPFFNGSVQTSGIAPSHGRPPVVPQVSPDPVLRVLVPSPTPPFSSHSSVDLSEADTSVDFSWHPDEEDMAYYPNLATDSLASLPLDFLQTPLPLGLGFSSECNIGLTN